MKVLSSVFTVSLFLIFSFSVNAQRTDDVVYLSNGSVIRGTLVSDSTENRVRILNKAGDIWAFSSGEVDSIRQEKAYVHKAFVFNQKGSELGVSTSLLIRSGSNAIDKPAIPGFYLAYSYRFNPRLSLGSGLGVEFYEWMITPVSLTGKLRITNHTVNPYFYARTGYSIAAEKREDDWDYSYTGKGGIHATIGFGIERIMNENTSFNIRFSYNYQELHYHLEPLQEWVQERDRKRSYSRLRISLGYVFK